MDRELWQRVEASLHEALEKKPGGERSAYLASLNDAVVRAEVESLLAADADQLELDLEHAIAGTANRVVPADTLQTAIGSQLSRYRLIELLGAGGMSQVFLAQDLQLGRKVAVKILPRAFSIHPEHVRRFEQEARAASALNHPNIVTIYEIGNVDARWFIAMEHIEGEALHTRIGRGPLPIGEALEIAAQVCAALELTHQHGILHRDIKPANIMLRSDGLVKVLDFGIARMDQAKDGAAMVQTVSGTVLGTPSYMSPEQASGRELDYGTDLWGLGAVLYEMLTGTMAFRAANQPELLQAILERRPSLPSSKVPSLPPEIDDLVMRLLAKSPGARFASAGAAREAIRQIHASLQPAPAPALPAGTENRTSRGRRKTWMAGAIAAIAGSMLVGAYFWSAETRRSTTLEPLTTTVAENRVTAAAYSPDGRTLAWAEFEGPLILRTLESNAQKSIELPRGWFVETISISSDGGRLILSGYSTADHQPDIRALHVAAGTLEMVQANARSGLLSPDGGSIAFTDGGRTELWISDVNGKSRRRLLAAASGSSDTFPVHFWLSPGRIGYQRRHFAPKPGRPVEALEVEGDYEYRYGSAEAVAAATVTASPHETLTPPMNGACAVDDGRVLFVTRDSGRSWASRNLWSMQTDPATGAVRTGPRAETNWQDRFLISLSCSRDGRSVGVTAQVGRATVYVADVELAGVPRLVNTRLLTMDEKPQYPQSWSSDSKSVFFEKGIAMGDQPVGQWDIYRQSVSERTAQPLATTLQSELFPLHSTHPEWLLFQSYDEKQGSATRRLMRIPARGGAAAEAVATSGPFDEVRCSISGKRCVLRVTEGQEHLYYDLDPVAGRGKELLRKPWMAGVLGDWDLSSDGSKIAIPNHDPNHAAIRVLALGSSDPQREQSVIVPGLANLRGVHWSAGDGGWFVSATVPTGVALLYVDRNSGRATLLREVPVATWGVPSPNGRHLAFAGQELRSNFWRVSGL